MTPRNRPNPGALRWAVLVLCLGSVTTCADGVTGPEVLAVSVSPNGGLAVGIGSTLRFSAETLDASGRTTFTNEAEWRVDDPAIATIDPSGLATAVAEGATSVTATVGGISRTVALEVYVPPVVDEYLPGVTYSGRLGYVTYVPGELPVVLSAPHGGALTPDEIPNRSWGVTGSDRNTLQLTLAVRDALIASTGYAPHVVLSELHRVKLDPNREIEEAAQGSSYAENAWEEFHGFIEEARTRVTQSFGGGMYFDMHGHGHTIERLELGYLLSSDRLNQPDAALNSLGVVQTTSVREIGRTRPDTFAEVIRGATSLGGFLEAEGVASLPSPGDPMPGSDPYFTGGYSTRRHGSISDTELVSGIQIEHHFRGIRDSEANRAAYAARLAEAIEAYLLEHFGFFTPPP